MTSSKTTWDSGYVRLLQEMIAAGWSDAVIGARVRELLQGWLALLVEITRQAEATLGALGPFPPEELAALVGQAFLGGEALLLLGFERRQWPVPRCPEPFRTGHPGTRTGPGRTHRRRERGPGRSMTSRVALHAY